MVSVELVSNAFDTDIDADLTDDTLPQGEIR
jgi:hypothetical protein